MKKFTDLHRLIIFIIVILTFCMRPFVFGLDSKIALIPLFFCGLVLLFTLPYTNTNIKADIIIISFFYLVYFIGLMISDPVVTLINIIPYLGEIVISYMICRNIQALEVYFKYLKNVFLILVVLGIVNFVIGFFYDLDKLILIRDISYNNDVYVFSLYFPISWSGMLWYINDVALVRQYYFFIEPGMVPSFFTALIYIILVSPKERHKRLQITLLVIGILLTYSTGGPLILLSSIGVYYFIRNLSKLTLWKIILGVGLLAVAWYVYMYMPFFGREAKAGLSLVSEESVETHENALRSYVMIGSMLIWACGVFLMKHKNNSSVSITIAFLMGLGYLSNYIGYTTLTTLFLLWDQSPMQRIPIQRNSHKDI